MTSTPTPPTAPKKLAIIDGKSVFYRGYYAMPNLSTKDGTPTGGVFGFATMALEVIRKLKPDYVCVAWDKSGTNIRRRLELYPEYKAGRKPAPPDFKAQIPVLHELLDAFGWPLYEMDDYEADDIMGSLAVQAAKQGIDSMLITSDLDMLQLIDPHIHVYALKKGLSNIELYSPESFEAKYGIRVDQFLDLKSLKGDSSDNIPGVPGIGEKGAVELLQKYETLDKIYENVDLLKDGVAKKLKAGKDLAYLSKELAAIWTDAPIPLDLAAVDGSKCNAEKLLHLLQKLEFRSLARQLPEIMQVAITNHQDASPQPSGIGRLGRNIIVDTNGKLLELKDDLRDADQLVIYSRAAGKHGKQPQLLAVSPSANRVFTILLDKVSSKYIQETLGPLLANEAINKIGHDLKTTIQLCYELGMDFKGVAHDTQIGAFLLDALTRALDLTDIARNELNYEGAPLEEGDLDEIASKMPEIVAVITALTNQQVTAFKDVPKIAELAKTIEFPVIPVLAAMEYDGIKLDTQYLKQFASQVEDMISDLEQQIYGHADQEFNIGSPSQLAEVLFTGLNLPSQGIKRGKTGFSTAASELDKLRGLHPIIDLITQWREVTKLKNTYIDTLPEMVDEDSRLHTTFSLTVTPTGRLSSNDPNLQNIPVRTELGKHIRTAFVASTADRSFVSADYSQFELRLAAYLAGDDELVELFNNGADVHVMTAAQVYGRQPDEITKQMRRDAKVINFGVLYGMSPHGLSIATGMTLHAAKEFIDKYFELRKPLLDYMNHLKDKARKDGYVETLFGRRRPTPDVKSGNFVVRQAAERAAINMPIQGTEADLMKMAMIVVQDRLAAEHPTARQLLQIHDSILVECDDTDVEAIKALLKESMENVYKLPVRLDVDVSSGKNWGEL